MAVPALCYSGCRRICRIAAGHLGQRHAQAQQSTQERVRFWGRHTSSSMFQETKESNLRWLLGLCAPWVLNVCWMLQVGVFLLLSWPLTWCVRHGAWMLIQEKIPRGPPCPALSTRLLQALGRLSTGLRTGVEPCLVAMSVGNKSVLLGCLDLPCTSASPWGI